MPALHPALLMVLQLALSLVFTLASVLVFFYAERKGSAFIQDRLGPTHVGKMGLLQPAADLIKLLGKETIVPASATKSLFLLAPFLVFAVVFSGFALLPLWPQLQVFQSVPGGLLLMLGIVSIDAIALLMAGYASRSKFPLIGAGRAVAQMVSYEVPLGISVLCFFWISGSAELHVIESLQFVSGMDRHFGLVAQPFANLAFHWQQPDGLPGWNAFRYPVLWLLVPVFYATILAESNRAPFDIPEGESEIIGGFHTEYSGFLWAVFFLAEYAMMLILSLIMSYLFFGGSASPIPSFGSASWISNPSFFWLVAKSWLICLSMIWVRWTLPRLRVDQLMTLSWKVLTPLSLAVFSFCILCH